MLRQLLVGTLVSVSNIAIHALVTTLVLRVARLTAARKFTNPSLHLIGVMIATVTILMAAHTCEIFVWSLAYALADAAPAGSDLMYFAFVNYTTLGYGDITPDKSWLLLGPMAAMNGILLFGWSTAAIFEVLRHALAGNRPGQTSRTAGG